MVKVNRSILIAAVVILISVFLSQSLTSKEPFYGLNVVGELTDANLNVAVGPPGPPGPAPSTLCTQDACLYVFHAHSSGIVTGVETEWGGVYMNGKKINSTGRSWGLTVVGGSGTQRGKVLLSKSYDVYGNGEINGLKAEHFIADFNSWNRDNNILIATTFDEPQRNADSIRNHLHTYAEAKKVLGPNAFRYAYCLAYRNGFGSLGEASSSFLQGSSYTSTGMNTPQMRCSINFSVVM